MISGLLSAVLVLSAAVTPVTTFASEINPEEELKEYVESLPELEQVKTELDADEIVAAKDMEVDFDAEIDLKKDFTNLDIPEKKKVNVKFYEAKGADKKDFAANKAGTYKAVYYVEPVNDQHPAYRISRNITVKEPVTETQTSAEGNETSGDETSDKETEDAESDPDEESSPVAETEVSETTVPETVEVETAETVVPETAMTKEAVQETHESEETEKKEVEAEAAETEAVVSETRESETSVNETAEAEPETELVPSTVLESVEETTESIPETMVYPADIREVDVDGVIITVAAPEGAFPDGWTVKAKRISQIKSEGIAEAIDEKFNGNVNKAASYTFDISILNAEGEEIQPENGKKVQVSFAMKEVESAGNLDVNVYHIEEGDQQIDKLKTQVEENTVTVTTDGFSWYTVEFTYNDLQYVMPGGQSIALSDILERVELSGTVSDVSVSNSGLFYPYQDKNGVWFIQSVEAFHTKEWMKVTIDGIVYEIVVTDATTFTPDYTTKATIERETWVGFGDVGDGSTARFHVEFTDSKGRSVKQDGYCVEPHWYAADGTYEKVGIKELKDSKKLAKVVYYGTESLSGDDCFFKQSGNTKYSAGEQFGIVHWAAAKIYGSDEWSYCSNSTGKKAAEALIDYAESMPSIPDAEISFSKESVTATVPSGADYQKTPSVTFKADTGNSITITLPKYVTYHDETNGKESAQSTGDTKVTIEAGTKFYFTAPLKYSGSMDDKWTVNAKGTYTKDLQAYLLDPGNERQPVAVVETFKGDRTASFTVEWLKTAKLTVVKTDAAGKRKLSGAVFGVYSDKACTDLLVKMPATDVNGSSTVELETSGTVYLKELTPPKGYRISVNSEGVTVSAGETTTKTVPNEEIKGELKVYKQGQVLTGAASDANGTTFKYETAKLAGATYSVTAGADITDAAGTVVYKKGAAVATLKTNANGEATLSNLPLGPYVITETGAPVNHVNKGESKTVTLKEGSNSAEAVVGTVTFNNDRQKAKVTVVKQDDTTKNPLSGGIYGLYAGADIKAADGKVVVKKDTFIEKVTTGSDGNAVFKADLPLNNSYYVKELQAPKNYFRNENDVYSFTFSYTNEKQAEVAFSHTFKNERVDARIDLIKVDAETGEPQGDAKLGKATYGLYARENIVHPDGKTGVLFKAGAQVATLTTDDDGKAYTSDLYLGKYFIKEMIPSEGYLLDEKEYDLDCAYEGDLVKTVKKTTTSKEQVIKQPFQVIKAANNGKTDADLLKGVGFSAYLISSLTVKADGSYDFSKAKPIVLTEDGKTEMFTDEKGYAVSIPIPYGKYIVRETTTPHNYTPVDDFKVTISENHPKEPQQWRVLLDDEFEAKLKIIKKDDETKKPVLLPKTEFKVYDMDHKKYVEQVTTYPSTVTHKSYFTDENGYLILPNNLKIGRYRIEEVTAPNGYVLNHNTFEVLVDSNTAYQMDQTSGDAIIEVAMENQPVKGKLTIKKAGEVLASFDKDFGYEMTSLADAEFSVYAAEDIYTPDWQRDENGNRIVIYAKDALVATVTTDAEGIAVVEDLPLGSYRIEETKAPYGFVLNTEPQTITFAYADQETPVIEQTAEFTNDRQKVEISVEKQDVETGKKLSGAVFGLYAASAIESADHKNVLVEADTLLEEVMSDENGLAAFTLDLPIGQYYVKEHKAPAGYVSSDEILTFDAGYQGQDVPVMKLTAVKKNEPTTFEFTKSDITTGTELEGAVLTILTRSGDVIERWTSVKNEPHMVKCLTAGESYVLREEFAPYGYLRATDVVFTVEDTAEIQKVEMKDEVPTALLIINKKGEFLDKVSLVDNAKGTVEHMFEYISGNLTPVTFEVYSAEDIKAADGSAPDYYKKDDLIGTITTDDIGIAKLGDLPVGKYYVVEKETAYGYVLDNEPRFVDLSYRDQDTPIVVYDEKWQNARQKVAVSLWKKEKDTNTPLKGAVFGLFAAEDIKSKDGKVLIEKDALIEQKTTDADGKIAFIADLPIDGKYYLQEIAAPNGYVNTGEKKEFTFTYEGSSKDMLSYSFTFINEPTTVEISKTDITDGKELPGAHLRVIDENANVIDEWVSEEQPHIIQKLVVGREYELIETKPADGYVTAESVSFKIENTGIVQRVKMEDDVTKVRLSKSDITTGKEVPGAKLTILDESGKVVETWTSSEEAHYIEKLPIGKYTLREETAPEGYLVAEDVKFTVKDTGIEQNVEMKDDYTKVEITKSDITDGKPVIGAKLTIFDKDGKEVESWVTEEKPHYIEKLPVGEYTLREVTAPEGYLRAEDVKFTVKDTGEIQKVVMKDDYTKVEVSKQDITNSKELPGAKLTIFDKDGKEVESWVSEEKPHYIEKLPAGEYTLREVTAPDGYEVAEDVKFTVEETGEIQHVVMKDAPKKQPETTPTPEKTTTPDNPTNPTTPTTETPKKETPTTPKTGDDRSPLIWLLLVGIGGCMAGIAWYLRKKDDKDQNQD